MSNSSIPILVICGPTASGKTSLALKIAEFLPEVNILSADSRQIYDDLEVVTGKDIPRDLPESIKFFGVGIAKSDTNFNLSDFVNYSKKVISDSIRDNIPLIIVGGTGLYLKAITQNLLDVHVPPDPSLRSKLEQLTVELLQKKLKKINREKYESLNHSDLFNPRRLIRAIEISIGSPPLVGVDPRVRPSDKHASFFWIGLTRDKEILVKKIRHRVIDRIQVGAVEEVSALRKKVSDIHLPIFSSLGISQIIQYLDGKTTREKMIDDWAATEVEYARRQMVWFKKQKGIVWYDKDRVNSLLIKKLAKTLFQND